MHGHPANRLKNIEAQRQAGVDPEIGEWPGDQDYVEPHPDHCLCDSCVTPENMDKRISLSRDREDRLIQASTSPASEGGLSERSDPPPSEAVRAAAAESIVQDFVNAAMAAQDPEEARRAASECNDVSRLIGLEHDEVLREIAASIHGGVQALNVFLAEAARRGVSVRITSEFDDKLGDAKARPIKLSVKLKKIL